MILHLEKEEDFEKEIQGDLVLVDFYADWCGPCQMLIPIIEQLEKETGIKVIKIDTDEMINLAQSFRIMSIPTLLLFKNGKLVNKSLGYMPIEALREFVK